MKWILLLSVVLGGGTSGLAVHAQEPLAKWHTLTLDFEGPVAAETDTAPNPFLDYRLQVRFAGPSGQQYDVPGYFAAGEDGRGRLWRVHFTPDEAGTWRYEASFHAGTDVAISLDPEAGEPAYFDGQSGEFVVSARDEDAAGFAKWGRLQYAGGYYLKFADGPYWIRGGTDSPENLLAYAGFDNTPPSHTYETHADDWRPGDPDWGDGRARGIIGMLNYLDEKQVNSIYLLLMNLGGDGQDVWPWVGNPEPSGSTDNDNLHYDVSKLDQWEIVFRHAQRGGIFLHFVLNEAEEPNKRELDDGELGRERKLYYREMVARFGHHLALQWNLCEEYNLGYDLGPERIRSYAAYLNAVDPYDHPITVHSSGDPVEALRFTFGDSLFSMTSIQLGQRRIDEVTEAFRQETQAAGRPIPVSLDEFTIDAGQERSWIPQDIAELHRKEKIWPTYLSGGNLEFILQGLLETDTLKTPPLDSLWNFVSYGRAFLEELPFWEMEPADDLVIDEAHFEVGIGDGETSELGAQVLAKRGEVYAVYLPVASPAGEINLTETDGEFRMRWYNPREGVFEGATRTVQAGQRLPFGRPPRDAAQDWAVLITR